AEPASTGQTGQRVKEGLRRGAKRTDFGRPFARGAGGLQQPRVLQERRSWYLEANVCRSPTGKQCTGARSWAQAISHGFSSASPAGSAGGSISSRRCFSASSR